MLLHFYMHDDESFKIMLIRFAHSIIFDAKNITELICIA